MKTMIGVVVAIAFVAFGWQLWKGGPREASETPKQEASTASPADVQTETGGTFTMDEIAAHKDASSCYTVIRGTVYDVTAFIDKHPGGDKNILRLCGIDGTAAFEGKHGGQEKPENALKGFEIGMLAR